MKHANTIRVLCTLAAIVIIGGCIHAYGLPALWGYPVMILGAVAGFLVNEP